LVLWVKLSAHECLGDHPKCGLFLNSMWQSLHEVTRINYLEIPVGT
jgi:hypothetical protein